MSSMPATAEILKDKYCRGDNSECARFMVFQKLGKDSVPADLFPGQVERVQKIIQESGK